MVGIAGAVVGSAVIGAGASIAGGVAAKDQADTQAEISLQQAARAEQVGAAAAEDFRRTGSATAATGAAVGAASGVVQTTGSAKRRQENFAAEVELQALRLENNADVQVARLRQEADFLRDLGRAKLIGAGLRAGSQILSGIGGKPGLDIDSNLQPQFGSGFKTPPTQRITTGPRQGFL